MKKNIAQIQLADFKFEYYSSVQWDVTFHLKIILFICKHTGWVHQVFEKKSKPCFKQEYTGIEPFFLTFCTSDHTYTLDDTIH